MLTIKELAKLAGVSASTVSRALSGDKRVNEKTRKEIEKISREQNYTPNFSARALTGKGTHLIGVIVPEIRSNYFAQMVDYIEAALSAKGYTMIVGTTGWDAEKTIKRLEIMAGRNVDGIILYENQVAPMTENYIQRMDNNIKMPLVLVGGKEANDLEAVIVDECHGIHLAIRHLASLGHRHIGYIGEDISSLTRLDYYREALTASGLPYTERYAKAYGSERFEEGGYLRMQELLKEKDLPTAIFCAYDYLAIGAMKAAIESGIRIPQDLSVVGFDNIRESAYLLVPLTTVYPPVVAMAHRAVDILLEKITGGQHPELPPATTIIRPELIVRASTTALA